MTALVGRVDVVVVGAGPSGLSAATALAEAGAAVMVLEREAQAGGVPRHCHHQGFGLRDLGRSLSGPAYAQRRVERAGAAGATVLTSSTVTGWQRDGDDFVVSVTSPQGRYALRAAALVVATGCRERPRPARLVPGARPEGVMTTGALQQRVHELGLPVGRRAVVVGAEHVSYSAVLTLAQAGCEVVAMTTEERHHTSYPAFDLAARLRWSFPRYDRTRVTDIVGQGRVEAVELTRIETGARRRVAADTVVFTGDWVPDHELLRRHDVGIDPATRGPWVDTRLRTDLPGVFAVGNLVHPAETADVCALDGRHVAGGVLERLAALRVAGSAGSAAPAAQVGVPVVAEAPLLWVAPQRVSDERPPPRGRFLLRASAFRRLPRLTVEQGDRVLWSGRVAQLVPDRSASVPAGWVGAVDPAGPAVRVGVR